MRFLLPLLFALSAMAQPNPPPSTNTPPAAVCVPFIDNPAYCRTECGLWYLTNWGCDSVLYLNGVQQSTEAGGFASIDFLAWPVKRTVSVGIIDSEHGQALDNIITNVYPDCALFHSTPDAQGVLDCISNGCEIILDCTPTALQGQSTTDLSNACWTASQSNIVLVASVQNSDVNIDSPSTPSYPGSWNLPLSIPVTASTRIDTVYSPAATGSNVIAAPGRVIVTLAPDGTPAYGTGCSYAAPMVAGVVAFLLGQFQQTPTVIVNAIRKGARLIDSRIAGRVSMLGAVNALRPSVRLSVDGLPGASYAVERSDNLLAWSPFATVSANSFTNVQAGFYRARIL